MNDDKQLQETTIPDHSKPVEHKPDKLSIEDAMNGWRKIAGDAVALARTLTVAGTSTTEQAFLFINAAHQSANQIIVNELARLYQVERNHESLKFELESTNRLVAMLREQNEVLAGKKDPPTPKKQRKAQAK